MPRWTVLRRRLKSGCQRLLKPRTEPTGHGKLTERIAELEKANNDLKGQAARLTRKTLSPLVTALLSKSSVEVGDKLDPAMLDKTLQSLSVEQRIAVKAEMARAGMIE